MESDRVQCFEFVLAPQHMVTKNEDYYDDMFVYAISPRNSNVIYSSVYIQWVVINSGTMDCCEWIKDIAVFPALAK